MSRRQLDALLDESGAELDAVDRAHLHDELGVLLALVDDAPPAPSPELAGLLGLPAPSDARPADARPSRATGAGPAVVALRRPGHPAHGPGRRLTGPRGAVTGAVVLAVATVGATGLSAAANSLPAPLQRQVADLSRTYLPFDFPEPRGAVDRPLPGARPAPQPHAAVPDHAPDGAIRQDPRVPTPGREVTLPGPGPGSSAATADPDPGAAPGSRPASPGPSSAARPTPSTRPRSESDVAAGTAGAAGPRGTSARPTGPARSDDASGSQGSTSDAPTAPRAGRPDAAPPTLAIGSPRPGRPGPSPSKSSRPTEPAQAADEASGQVGQGKADRGPDDQVPDDRGERDGRGSGSGKGQPGQGKGPGGRDEDGQDGRLLDPVVDRTLGGVAGSLGRD